MATVPLLTHAPRQRVLDGPEGPVDREQFVGAALALAERLPDRPYALHLCEDRHRFLLAFVAAQLRGQTLLLAPDRANRTLSALADAYPDSYCLVDRPTGGLPLSEFAVELAFGRRSRELPSVDASHVAAVPFTSGTTGDATAHPKRWGELVANAHRVLDRLAIAPDTTVIATVPAQHMFGLEASIMLPLAGALTVTSERPLFPADVREAMCRVSTPRLLVTTPFHIRALAAEKAGWPPVDLLLSATAPLDQSLAEQAEQVFGAPVMEIFGSTETGAIATRRTVAGERWQPLPDFRLQRRNGRVSVHAAHLDVGVALGDDLKLHASGEFTFRGRSSDMVKVAGKRASLEGLNRKLLGIEGVVDGAFVSPDSGFGRLAALVVAPHRSERELMAALRECIDPAFLPRPLVRVSQLPRNATGKLPRDALLRLLKQRGAAK